MLMLVALGCSRNETPPSAPAAAATRPAPPVAGAPAAAPSVIAGPGSPAPSANPGAATDMNDFSDTADFEWDLEEEASGPDFEIDAATTSFYMPRENIVTFKAKALNGTPPFTFSWDFGDGTPPGTGEMIKHRFEKIGNLDVTIRAKDASGATASMQLGILVHHPVDYAYRMQMSEKEIAEIKARYPDWVPASPVPTP